MEVSRMIAAFNLIQADFEKRDIRGRMKSLVKALKNAAANPAEASHQEQFNTALKEAREALQAARANEAPISIVKALEQVGATKLIGSQIEADLNAIMAELPFLLQPAAASLEVLNQEITAQYDRTVAALTALSELGFDVKGPMLEDAEVGILMPSSFTENDLRVIKDHLHSWLRHIDTLEEIVHGQKRDKIAVTSVSSGSFDLFISIDLEGVLVLLLLAKGAAAIMNSVRDAERRREEMSDASYPESVIEGMKDHEQTLVQRGIEEIKKKVLTHKSRELKTPRLNELKNGLDRAIDYVLKCMNRGVDVEVSLPPKAKDAEAEVSEEINELRNEIAELNRQLADLTKRLPDRSEPLLHLPGPTTNDQAEDTSRSTKKKSKPSKKSRKKKT